MVRVLKILNDCCSRVRLLSDGSLLYISGRRKWELLDGDGVDFCFDGMQNYDDAGPTSKDGHASSTGLSPWPEEEQVLIVCVSDIPLPQSVSGYHDKRIREKK